MCFLKLLLSHFIVLTLKNQVVSGALVVSSLIGYGSENLYLQYRRLAFEQRSTLPKESDEEKLGICEAILYSPFIQFHFSQENAIVHSESSRKPENSSEDPHKYPHNPYTAHNVTVFGFSVTEISITCNAKHGLLKNIEYFVSREYYARSLQLRVRFVFERSKKKKITVIAIAESPIDPFYSPERTSPNLGGNDFSLELCSLRPNERIRFCGLVSGSYYFPMYIIENAKYSPYKDNVVPECEQKKLSFSDEDDKYQYIDWVLTCNMTCTIYWKK